MERVREVLREGVACLEASGLANPRLEAEVLLAHTLGIERTGLYLDPERPLSRKEIEDYRDLLARRRRREPLGYITGRREFWSLDFETGPGVLIPRQETELVVEEALHLLPRDRPLRVLDLGTGCGVISIVLALELKEVRIWATDISEKALSYAKRNALLHGVGERVRLLCGKDLDPFRQGQIFDAILSNPPYVPTGEIDDLQPEICRYEPKEALDGGEDGLSVIRGIIREVPSYLTCGGWLILEIGAGQAGVVAELVERDGRYGRPTFRKDYSGIERVMTVQRL